MQKILYNVQLLTAHLCSSSNLHANFHKKQVNEAFINAKNAVSTSANANDKYNVKYATSKYAFSAKKFILDFNAINTNLIKDSIQHLMPS
jgi:hypothetical protein